MTKIKVTAQQRANAIEALEVMWPSVPPENVIPRLARFRDGFATGKPDCRTLACFGGWCAWWPSFRRQGICAAASGGRPEVEGKPFDTEAVTQHLFGTNWTLFDVRGKRERGTDHEVVTARLKRLIANSVVA